MSSQNLSKLQPGSPIFRKYLADKLGLLMLVDIRRTQYRYPAQFIVGDTLPADHIKLLPKAHWKVIR